MLGRQAVVTYAYAAVYVNGVVWTLVVQILQTLSSQMGSKKIKEKS
jgi:hypothetical protein